MGKRESGKGSGGEMGNRFSHLAAAAGQVNELVMRRARDLRQLVRRKQVGQTHLAEVVAAKISGGRGGGAVSSRSRPD